MTEDEMAGWHHRLDGRVYIRYVSLEGVPLTVIDMGLLKSSVQSLNRVRLFATP